MAEMVVAMMERVPRYLHFLTLYISLSRRKNVHTIHEAGLMLCTTDGPSDRWRNSRGQIVLHAHENWTAATGFVGETKRIRSRFCTI
mmetsp:Transcript_26968/g.49960  ORF Transcript_26968/g.49960 Transcript_26968/m.49960 type:complete len:87 (+) Transcript_26968:1370-1630(+)